MPEQKDMKEITFLKEKLPESMFLPATDLKVSSVIGQGM
jgi:hypothetical protein